MAHGCSAPAPPRPAFGMEADFRAGRTDCWPLLGVTGEGPPVTSGQRSAGGMSGKKAQGADDRAGRIHEGRETKRRRSREAEKAIPRGVVLRMGPSAWDSRGNGRPTLPYRPRYFEDVRLNARATPPSFNTARFSNLFCPVLCGPAQSAANILRTPPLCDPSHLIATNKLTYTLGRHA